MYSHKSTRNKLLFLHVTAMEVTGIQINTAKLLKYTDLLKVKKMLHRAPSWGFTRYNYHYANQLVWTNFFERPKHTELYEYVYMESVCILKYKKACIEFVTVQVRLAKLEESIYTVRYKLQSIQCVHVCKHGCLNLTHDH